MFRRYSGRRSPNILVVIFRLCLSLVMMAILAGGLYSAYKHFSGLDPLKIDPKSVIISLINSRSPQEIIGVLTSLKIATKGDENQNILGQLQNSLPGGQLSPDQKEGSKSSRSFVFSFALFSDSHADNLSLRKALAQIKEDYPTIKFLIGLGDYTDVGTLDELKNAKKELDNGGFRYFLIPGDHDLWDSRNKSLPTNANFKEIFGPSYQSFTEEGFLFVLLNNSDNYLGIGDEQFNYLSNQLEKGQDSDGIFVFLHEPIFHPSSDHVMGRVENKLKDEAKRLMQIFFKTGVNKVFAGDIHFFSEYSDPETNLSMVTVGAVTSERNTQASRFAIAKVYSDGSLEVEDVEIK